MNLESLMETITTMTSTKRVIVVVGATASGKTDLSIALARNYNAPILSMDSRQVYKGLPIGTAYPSNEQLSQTSPSKVRVAKSTYNILLLK